MKCGAEVSGANRRALLLGLIGLGSGRGQEAIFKAESRLVEVPVVVRDKRTGLAVRGLRVEDFALFENGQRVRIELFVESSAGVVDAVSANEVESARGSNLKRNEHSTEPLIAILIDGLNARFEDQLYATRSARAYIEKQQGTARWAIYYLGRNGIRVLHDYSKDVASLVNVLEKLRGTGADPETMGTGADFAAGAASIALKRSEGEAGEAQFVRRVMTTLDALRDLASHFHGLPGRKALVWMSAGFSLQSTIRLLSSRWRRTLDDLNDANVAVYAVDSMGVRAGSGYLAESPSSRELRLRGGVGSPMGDVQVLQAVAEATGGAALINSNNLARGFNLAIGEARDHYRLAYRTAVQRLDDRVVPLKVKVLGRKGLAVRHRSSFVAREQSVPEQGERDKLLLDSILSPVQNLEIGMEAELAPTAQAGQMMLRLTMQPGTVTFAQEAQRLIGLFDVRCVQFDPGLGILDDFTEAAKLDLVASEAERVIREGFRYELRLVVKEKAKFLKIAYSDVRTGRRGSLRIELATRRSP